MVKYSVQVGNIETLLLWEKALLLLSLDRVMPFREDMGLRMPEDPGIQRAVREFLEDLYKRQRDDSMEIYLETTTIKLEGMFTRISATGSENAASVWNWVVDTYAVFIQQERWYETWQILFLRLAEGRVSQLYGQGIAQDKVAQIEGLVEQWRVKEAELNARIQAADDAPLVGWDAEQYARYRKTSPDGSPLDYLSSFLNNYAFSSYWKMLVELLLPWEMAVLNRWGQIYTAVGTTIPPAWAQIPARYIGGDLAPEQ